MYDVFSDLIKVLLPAGLVLYAVFQVVRAFLNKQLIEKQQETRSEAFRQVLPLRLQAYERLSLLLERLSPNALLLRNVPQVVTSLDLQQVLVAEIREEVHHNAAQQMYVSNELWDRVRLVSHELTSLVNKAAAEVSPDAPAIELARKIGEQAVGRPSELWQETLNAVKNEARQLWE
jgi:hypothetical protein